MFLFFKGKFCGRTTPKPVESSDNTMVVRFKSDHRLTSKGFSASFTSFSPTPATTTTTNQPATTTSGESPP